MLNFYKVTFFYLCLMNLISTSYATMFKEKCEEDIIYLKKVWDRLDKHDGIDDLYNIREHENGSIKIYPKTFNDSENSKNIRNLIVLGKKGVEFLEINQISKSAFVSYKDNQKIELDKLLVRGFNWNIDSEKMEKYLRSASFTLRNLGNNEYTLDVSHSLLGGGAFFSKTSEQDEYYSGFTLGYTLQQGNRVNIEEYLQVHNFNNSQKANFRRGFTDAIGAKKTDKILDIAAEVVPVLAGVGFAWGAQGIKVGVLTLVPVVGGYVGGKVGEEVGGYVGSKIGDTEVEKQKNKVLGKQYGKIGGKIVGSIATGYVGKKICNKYFPNKTGKEGNCQIEVEESNVLQEEPIQIESIENTVTNNQISEKIQIEDSSLN